jgi:hypothetical protein
MRIWGLSGNSFPANFQLNMAATKAVVAASAPKWLILHYGECVPDVLSRIKERGPAFEQAHLSNAQPHLDSGKLLAAGAVGNPVDGGLWIFKDVTKVNPAG